MADDTVNISDLGNVVDEVKQSIADAKDQVNSLGQSFHNVLGDKLVGYLKAARSLIDTDLTSSYKNFADKIENAPVEINLETGDFESSMTRASNSFLAFSQVISNAKVFQNFKTDSEASINSTIDNLGKLNTALKNVGLGEIGGGGIVSKILGNVADNISQGEKLKNTYLSIAAASGKLNDAFDGSNGKLKDLNALLTNYSERIGQTALVTGLSVDQTLQFASALDSMGISSSKSVNLGNSSMSTLLATMQLMSGSGRSMGEVTEILGKAFENLSGNTRGMVDSGQLGIEMFAQMSNTANTLGLRFDYVKGLLEETAKNFRFIGNETDATTKILGRYSEALQQTGLTSKASVDIVSDLTKNIGQLTMGTKALISQQSGMGGGLQGAFKIEQLVATGKLDEVMKMSERLFRQVAGGRIYTREEAANSPQAAAGFMRQRQLLQSGAVGFKIEDENAASKFLEALSRGNLGAAKGLMTGTQAAEKVTERGSQVQQNNNNLLKIANTIMERNAMFAEISASANMQTAMGIDSIVNKQLLAPATDRARIAGEREDAQRKGGTTGTDRKMDMASYRNKLIADFDPIKQDIEKKVGNLFDKTPSKIKGFLFNQQEDEKLKKQNVGNNQNVQQDMRSSYNLQRETNRSAGIVAHRPEQLQQGNTGNDQDIIITVVAPPGFKLAEEGSHSLETQFVFDPGGTKKNPRHR